MLWAIALQELSGKKGYFESWGELRDWIVDCYSSERERTKQVEKIKNGKGKEILNTLYELPSVSVKTLLEEYVHVVRLSGSKADWEGIFKESQ